MNNGLPNELTLKFGFKFEDLFESKKLKELSEKFYSWYKESAPESYIPFEEYRIKKGENYDAVTESTILIEAARYLQSFLGEFFGVENELEKLRLETDFEHVILNVKKDFIQRRVFKNLRTTDLPNLNFNELNSKVSRLKEILFSSLEWENDEEHSTAVMIENILSLETNYKSYFDMQPADFVLTLDAKEKTSFYRSAIEKANLANEFTLQSLNAVYKNTTVSEEEKNDYELIKELVDVIQKWCFSRYHDVNGKKEISGWIMYKFPPDMNYSDLVHNKVLDEQIPERMYGDEHSLRRRDGFKLTDLRYNNRETMSEVEYCVFCHGRKKDSCSKGLLEKDGTAKRNPIGIKLNGCPLDEKISEMHILKDDGLSLASLAMIMIDNPTCPGTGHRICNDCMKSCIYQRQEPVNIPQIETRVLTEVLNLPYGFEIYSLLTRWNPLNVKCPNEQPYNGKNILVVGMGPAGYTLAHYLLNQGFGVVGIDGLKIEPVHNDITGYVDENGNYISPKPLRNYSEINDELDKRIFLGFGGVSEYGITVRWDKNFLKVVYLTLARRKYFRIYDGIRFGGTLEIDDIWNLGFDHIAIATGAGKPTIVKMKNNLIRGIRKASDFLMALQLTGAAKKDSITNLMLQLPAIVIGGGLTAIDTATEAAAYYPIQVEKFLDRFEKISETFGEDKFWSMLDEEEKRIANTFIEHGKEIRAERLRAKEKNEEPNFVPYVRKWGGVTVAYRKSISDSPAYRLNHEEIIKSLEEGIYYWEKMNPVEAFEDEFGALKEVKFQKQDKSEEGKWIELDNFVTLPAKTMVVAAGTAPNVIYEREHPGTFELDEWKKYFQTFKPVFNNGKVELAKPLNSERAFFTSYTKDGKFITVYGDNHVTYAGNVVKAMASAKDGHKQLLMLFEDILGSESDDKKYFELTKQLDNELIATIESVNILTPTIVEVVINAPLQSRKFQPGQFYRLQNYEVTSKRVEGSVLLMEGLALTGAWVDKEKGLLSLIVLEMMGSSRLCRFLKKGERVVVMGPTGAPTEIPKNEIVLLAGGGLGNAVLFSIAKAMKENGNKVIYFAGYKNTVDLFKQDEVEEATDQVIWSNDNGEPINPRRAQDRSIKANIVQAMMAYADGKLESNGNKPIFDLKSVDRIIAIGSDRMMNAIKEARHGIMKDYFKPEHIGIGSINSTMQCMMKEVCAQCLQRHVDPQTGKEYFVFTCFNQDQNLDFVDFRNLNARLRSNSVLEKLTKFWIDLLLEKAGYTKSGVLVN